MPIEKDQWLLPQHDYPAREALSDATLHGRRETTFVALAGLFFVATTLLLTLGTSRVLDLSVLVPDAELPIAMQLPLGVLAFPLALAAVNLVCDLYGRRRASVLVAAGTLASLALVGCMRAADALDGGDAFGPSLALASCYVVAQLSNLMLFDAMRRAMSGRRRWLRKTVSTLLAQMGGWAVFAFVAFGYATYSGEAEAVAIARIVAIAAAACAYAIAFVVVGVVPSLVLARSLAVYLRAGRLADAVTVRPPIRTTPIVPRPFVPVPAPPSRALPHESARDGTIPLARVTIDGKPSRAERRSARGSVQAFSSAEMRFFTEGDALDESPADSSEFAKA